MKENEENRKTGNENNVLNMQHCAVAVRYPTLTCIKPNFTLKFIIIFLPFFCLCLTLCPYSRMCKTRKASLLFKYANIIKLLLPMLLLPLLLLLLLLLLSVINK